MAMNEPEIVRLKNSVSERDHSIGPANAPVTLVEYGNFECVHCGQFFPIIEQVRKVLGDNLRFVYRHFPSVKTHPRAMRAAEAAEAAAAQGKFWQMHHELFTHQRSLDDQHLSKYARRIGLDMERFQKDLSENNFRKQIEMDYQTALFDEHITGTPTLYINDARYTQLTDLDTILIAIKEADTSGRINLPAPKHGLKQVLDGLRHRAGQ